MPRDPYFNLTLKTMGRHKQTARKSCGNPARFIQQRNVINIDDDHVDSEECSTNNSGNSNYPYYSRSKNERPALPRSNNRSVKENSFFCILSLSRYLNDGFHSNYSNDSIPKLHGICRSRSEAYAWVERIFYEQCETGMGAEDILECSDAEVEEDVDYKGNGGLCLKIHPPCSEEWSVWAEYCPNLGNCPILSE